MFTWDHNSSIFHLLLASWLFFFSTHCQKQHAVLAAASTRSPLSPFSGPIANITADMPDEQRLFYTLMTGYEKAVRPTRKASEVVVVKLGITLTQIMDIVSFAK